MSTETTALDNAVPPCYVGMTWLLKAFDDEAARHALRHLPGWEFLRTTVSVDAQHGRVTLQAAPDGEWFGWTSAAAVGDWSPEDMDAAGVVRAGELEPALVSSAGLPVSGGAPLHVHVVRAPTRVLVQVYVHHSVLDGHAFFRFMEDWAAAISGRSRPVEEAAQGGSSTPPEGVATTDDDRMAARTFGFGEMGSASFPLGNMDPETAFVEWEFPAAYVDRVRTARSTLTAHDVVCGTLWTALVRAWGGDGPTWLACTVDSRPRGPSLHRGTRRNASVYAVTSSTSCAELLHGGVGRASAHMRAAILRVRGSFSGQLGGACRWLDRLPHARMAWVPFLGAGRTTRGVAVTNWTQFNPIASAPVLHAEEQCVWALPVAARGSRPALDGLCCLLALSGGRIKAIVGVAKDCEAALRRHLLQCISEEDSPPSSVQVSAPGKVLIAGGYLVTVRPNLGWVLAVTARLHARILVEKGEDREGPLQIWVDSPQFKAVQLYTWDSSSGRLVPDDGGFIGVALSCALAYVRCLRPLPSESLRVTVYGDDAFYSFPSASKGVPKKTGLGSSAALVTALCGAVLAQYGGGETQVSGGGAYYLAQIAHYRAQGKIGSGFDVSSALFGSHVYQRFDPALVSRPLESLVADVRSGVLAPPTFPPLGLPRGVLLLLGDVCAGAETPGMVRLVDAWRASLAKEDSESPWARLPAENAAVVASAQRLTDLLPTLGESAYDEEMARCATQTSDLWEGAVGRLLREFREAVLRMRALLKDMGVRCGADIEPDVQTARADDSMSVPGVLAAGVPGAGGLDALFALVLTDVAKSALIRHWNSANIRPLPLEEDSRGLLVD